MSERKLTDTQRFWLELRKAEHAGLHSWDCYGWTRNASQRAKDCVDKGQQVYVKTERRNGRAGARYWLEGFQPDDATAVRGNREAKPTPAEKKAERHWTRETDGEWSVTAHHPWEEAA